MAKRKCDKDPYPNGRVAHAELRRITRAEKPKKWERDRRRQERAAYRCPECGDVWHLTSQKKGEAPGRTRKPRREE